MSEIKIRLAKTDNERDAAYRLRFEVFTLEESDYRYADSTSRIYSDAHDGPNARILIAINHLSDVVGTLRLTYRREQPFLQDEIYSYEALANALGLPVEEVFLRTALVTRGVVRSDYRGSGLFTRIMTAADDIFRSEGISVVVGAVKSENAHSKTIFGRWNYTQYASSPSAGGYILDLIYRKLE